jgi:Reverse transcriptase (RNA-dependent DNA polymerase)
MLFFKPDIYKVFDTLDWQFLLNILKSKGFPNEFYLWIQHLVLSRVSKIIINSVAGRNIKLKRGVRQCDPISPYLFNLAMNFLVVWLTKLQDMNFVRKPFLGCKPCLQYADDTPLLLQPILSQLLIVKLIFINFARLSSLILNMHKLEIIITRSSQNETAHLALIIGCKAVTLPINYLGLPLSDKPLKKIHYQKFIQGYKDQLPGWKAHSLSIGGMLILINAVMAAKPIYFMSSFMIPKKVIDELDRIRN